MGTVTTAMPDHNTAAKTTWLRNVIRCCLFNSALVWGVGESCHASAARTSSRRRMHDTALNADAMSNSTPSQITSRVFMRHAMPPNSPSSSTRRTGHQDRVQWSDHVRWGSRACSHEGQKPLHTTSAAKLRLLLTPEKDSARGEVRRPKCASQ